MIFWKYYCSLLLIITRSSADSPSFTFISDLISGSFSQCKLFVIYFDTSEKKSIGSIWHDNFETIISLKNIISKSAGVTNIDLKIENEVLSTKAALKPFEPLVRQRPVRTIHAPENCHVVLLILPTCLPRKSGAEEMLNHQLNLPLLNPTTFRNQDKFLIIAKSSCIKSLHSIEVIKRLKYKLFMSSDEISNKSLHLYQYCNHCLNKETILNEQFVRDNNYFPDFQHNYFRSVLKVSATDKLPGLLEIETDSKTGVNFPKRGVYAMALSHLAKGLNFTWELHRSSGGGSTGHPLKNGTWLGTVGDIHNGKVDFGIVCGMTLIRHPIVELCATITFEYISYAVGPRARVYTWKAIFWPFTGFLWFGMIVSTVLVIIFSFILLKCSPEQNSSWSFLSVAQYYPRVFIEQADDLPVDLSQSVKIILGFWLMFALIGSTVYRAKMVGFMTFPVLESQPETFDELAKSKYDIQFHYFGNVAYNTFKTSTSPTYMTIFQKMNRQPNPLKCLKSTMNEKKPSSCILFGCVYEELKNRNLSDKFGQSPIRISPNYGFMYTPGVLHKKKADFSPNFKWILQNSMQMGLNQQWEKSDMNSLLIMRNIWLRRLSPPEKSNYTFEYNFKSSDVLHLENLKGAFSVQLAGIFLATLLFIGERIKAIWVGRKRETGARFLSMKEEQLPATAMICLK